MPVATPLITAVVPVVAPMVATPVEPLVHVPPDVVELNVVVLPTHIPNVPVIAAGGGLTVTVLVAVQPDVEV